jgi:hypothetical protein
MLSNLTSSPWINVAAVAAGVLVIAVLVAMSRKGPKKKAEPAPRTEAMARAAQANRDRLSGRR